MTEAADNKAKRDAIIRKVRALLAKTTENGAGEAEAMAAAEKAADLMRDYDLTFTDVKEEIEAETFGAIRRTYRVGAHPHPVVKWCCIDVAKFWDCKHALDRHGQLVFFGTRDDVAAAWAMLDMLRVAADTELALFWQSPDRPYGVKFNTARASFMSGFIDRVLRRLGAMKAKRTSASATGSTALVVVKNQIVAEKFKPFAKAEGMSTGQKIGSMNARDSHSFKAGAAAGDRAGLGDRSARVGYTQKIGSN